MLNPLQSVGSSPVPHILLPLAQVLALALPPFQYRAHIFIPIILFLVWLTWTNLFTASPSTRSLLLSQWPWYLGTIEKLLFTVPENAFWRIGRAPQEARNLAFWPKFKWASELYCSPRGIGWNFLVKGAPKPPEVQPSKETALLGHIKWATICYVSLDALDIYKQAHFYAPGVDLAKLTVRAHSPLRALINVAWALFTPYCALNLLYSQMAIISISLNLTAPGDWPPLYGPISSATTLRAFWNSWWHQCVRKVYTSYSQFVAQRVVGVRKGTWLSAYVQLYAVFLASGLGHGIVMYGLLRPDGYHGEHKLYDRFGAFFLCFALQAVAIQFEDTVIWCYRWIFEQKDEADGHQHHHWWHVAVGRLWLIIWVYLHAPLMADPCLRSGLAKDSEVPFGSILKPMLRSIGILSRVETLIA